MRFATICSVLSLLSAPLVIIAAPAPAPAAVANPEPHGWGYGKGPATGTFTGFGAVPTGGNDDNALVGNDDNAVVGNDDNAAVGDDSTAVGNDDSAAVGNDDNAAVGNDDNAAVGGNEALPSSIVGDNVPTPVVQGSTSNGNVAGTGADEDGEAVDEATTTTSSTRSTPTG
ncbi:MAG: hypothetical protein L6R42_009020 [Xanthoria sp. 1 TBL-2021]|nr:MAG: hypothetical protein L6R42_009020 [Xanthoria sp. 1 TBL-2021]